MMSWLSTISAIVVVTVGGIFGHFFGSAADKTKVYAEDVPTTSAITTGSAVSSSTPSVSAEVATTSLSEVQKSTSPSEKPDSPKIVKQQTGSQSKGVPKDWATFSSELGFSIHYPYKEMGAIYGDDEYFQILFFIPASIVSADANTIENISKDIHNLGLYGALSLMVIKKDASATDLESFAKAYLKKHDAEYGNHETVLSEKITPTTFAGVDGLQFDRNVEGEESQKSPRYVRREIFLVKSGFVYRISSLAPASDTEFPRSKAKGKEYLQRVDGIVRQILKTFVFDGSKITRLDVPRARPPVLAGEDLKRREGLLAALRARPYYDMNEWYSNSSDLCETEASVDNATRISISENKMYVSAGDDVADLHVYDKSGNHSGPLPAIPDFPISPIEERVSGVSSFDSGSAGRGFIFEGFVDGRIELVGKENGSVDLSFRGDGNACSIAEVPLLLMTKYSIATIPMTVSGDLGPISYDIDGDGMQDVEISLIHPLFPEKQRQLEAVFADVTGMKIVH